MTDKKTILAAVTPIAVLQALTPEAIEAMPSCQIAEDLIPIYQFPFRVGRESRVQKVNGRLERMERPKLNDKEPNNDLYLIDRGALLNISREHFKITKNGSQYTLVDRGSACGTKIGDGAVGGQDSGGEFPLKDGDTIAVGAKATAFIFKFITF